MAEHETYPQITELNRCVRSVLEVLEAGLPLSEDEQSQIRQAAGKLLLALDRWEPGSTH